MECFCYILPAVNFEIARQLGVEVLFCMSTKPEYDINLVALKVAHLAELGFSLRKGEYRSDFLK